MLAWACGLRTSAACRSLGSLMSSTKRPSPRSKRGSSTRDTEAQKYRVPTCSPSYSLSHSQSTPQSLKLSARNPGTDERRGAKDAGFRFAEATRALVGFIPPLYPARAPVTGEEFEIRPWAALLD